MRGGFGETRWRLIARFSRVTMVSASASVVFARDVPVCTDPRRDLVPLAPVGAAVVHVLLPVQPDPVDG